MKITKVYPVIVHASSFSNYVFVVVETNEGINGYGDATLDGHEFEVAAAVKTFGDKLIGKDILQDHFIMDGSGGGMITAAAVSGIDIALWDLKGKALNVPLYVLLGGAIRKSIPAYASFNRLITDRTPEGFARMAEQLVKSGNKGMKCHPFDGVDWRTPLDAQDKKIELGCQRFIAMREAVGSDIRIAVDAHWRFDLRSAGRVAERIRPYDPFWLEAPISEKKPEHIRALHESCGIRLAGGEMQTSPEALRPLLDAGCLDVYMPDIRYVGGVSGMQRMAAVLDTYNVLISPHNMCSIITCAASLHLAAAMKSFLHLEYHLPESPWLTELSDVYWEVKDGAFAVPEGPGLGVELKLDVAAKHPYEKVVPFRINMLGA